MTNQNKQLPGSPSDLVVTRVDVEFDSGAYYACGFKSTQKVLAITGRVGAGDDEQSLQCARRIAACLQACEGIETEVLEFFTERMHGTAKKSMLKDVADTDISALSAAQQEMAVSQTVDLIEQVKQSSKKI